MSARSVVAALALLLSLFSTLAGPVGRILAPSSLDTEAPSGAAEDETDRGAMMDPNG